MILCNEEHAFFRSVIQNFFIDYQCSHSWYITGDDTEVADKLINLLQGKICLTKANLDDLGVTTFDFARKVTMVSYREGIAGKHALYYQQRFYATEVDNIIHLKQYLFGENVPYKVVHQYYELLELFHLKHLLDDEIIKLSNGETRKASIFKALLSSPEILILENPFAGVDQKSLPDLHDLFLSLQKKGLGLIVFGQQEPPHWVTHILNINSYENFKYSTREEFMRSRLLEAEIDLPGRLKIPETPNNDCKTIVKLSHVSVAYGEKMVLNNINWTIKPHQKWLLKGENGAGKSTLLSLIYADHPQSYANDIELFDHQRGSGESIWDIKEKIAYYSPEQHLYFDKSVTCHEAILSGIHFHPFKKDKKHPVLDQFAKELFLTFFPEKDLELSLNQLTSIKQRLILFIRALSQNAPLVLLDEPFQGFDFKLTEQCKQLTNLCCKDKTLIFVSHNPEDIPSCIDHVYSLKPGTGNSEKI